MYMNIHYDYQSKQIHIWDDEHGYAMFPFKKYGYIKDPNGRYSSLYGDRLRKAYSWDYNLQADDLFESDIHPDVRYLIDTYLLSDEPSTGHIVLPIDIEVEVTDGFPHAHIAANKITSIALYDSAHDLYYALVLNEDKDVDDYTDGNQIVELFGSEAELLNRFYAKYLEIRPTIITGWNSNNFDIPYLFNRACKILGETIAKCLSPIGIVYKDKFKGDIVIAGVSCLDYYLLYKNFTYNELDSYKLDSVAVYEKLGQQKIKYSGTLDDLRVNDLRQFIKYNIQDVRLINLLDIKLNLIEIAIGICHIGHVPYESIYMPSRYLDGALLVYLKKLGIVAPNKNPEGRNQMTNEGQYEGAHVQKPQAGRYDWVYDLDITSMYPSIIMSLNISPETKTGKVIGWKPNDLVSSSVKTYTIILNDREQGTFTKTELSEFLRDNNLSISANGILYNTEKMGLMSSILVKWFDDRVDFRNLAKKFADENDDVKYQYFNKRQHIQKILLNSLYGVLALPVFRFYDLDNALAVTSTGQSLIGFTKKIANHFYNMELGSKIELDLEDGTTKSIYENQSVTVIRSGKQINILGNNIKNTDQIL